MALIAGALLGTVSFLLFVLHLVYPAIWKDLQTFYIFMKLIRRVKTSLKKQELITDQFEKQAKADPDKKFILFREQRYSYCEVDKLSNQAGRTLQALGVQTGDTVALLMTNEPAYIWLYLGILKIGAKAALVNCHLREEGLRYSIETCAPKVLIVGDGHTEDYLPAQVNKIWPNLDSNITWLTYSSPRASINCQGSFSERMKKASAESFGQDERPKLQMSDTCCFIFTSGTTGLPKPAIITHKKAVICSNSYAPVGFSSSDVMYLTLPLYHASATNLALLNVINVGATLVLREKFSASKFWVDCVNYDVTCFQYIGEMLRYLVNTPKGLEEENHKVWAAIGNGIRVDIWERSKSRFKLTNIYEFYGSTELPANTTNYFNIAGSVGRLSPLLSKFTGLALVEVETQSGEFKRDMNGRCIRSKKGGEGVLLAQISSNVSFEGYLGPEEMTNKKLVKDVFKKGDVYVNTNDMFTMDHQYNLFFKDRMGDCFRWKGENVSAAEVSNVMNLADFVQDTNVYGVTIPGCEGKAGMAAINLKDCEHLDDEKIDELGQLCKDKLPSYARPRFLRFQRQMTLTSTFKQQKTQLCQDGFNPSNIEEPLFFLDSSDNGFKRLNETIYDNIIQGQVNL